MTYKDLYYNYYCSILLALIATENLAVSLTSKGRAIPIARMITRDSTVPNAPGVKSPF